MSRRNSREGMERVPQGYHGNINQGVPGGYPVPFPHFPWNLQSHPAGTVMPHPPVPGQHGNRQDSQDNVASFYRNLPALQQSMNENSRQSTSNMPSSSNRQQQAQMAYQAHGMGVRFPPPLISDHGTCRVEQQNKDKGMNLRPLFSVPQTNRHARNKYPPESHAQRNSHLSGLLANQMNYHGMPFSQSTPDYNYPAISQMLEQESNLSHGRGPVPPWIPQLNQSQRIPHMSNLMSTQVRNPPSSTVNECAVPREYPMETFPEESTSPGLIGRWYKLPTDEKKNEPKVVNKASPESVSCDKSLEGRVQDSRKDNFDAVMSVSEKSSNSDSGDNRLGKLQGLIDRLRASKEDGNRNENAVVSQHSRDTITISPETCVQQATVPHTPSTSTIRISPEIPGMPLNLSESDVDKTSRSTHPPKDTDADCDISIINCFTLNSDGTCGSKEDIPIIIDDDNPRPSPGIVAGSGLEDQTKSSETFLQNEGNSISEIIIPASTLTIEANEISCTKTLHDERLPLRSVQDSSEKSEQVKSKDESSKETRISILEEKEKTATLENSRKESDQFRIKLKMSCTSESGIICRFSKIASAGIPSRPPRESTRESPDLQKSETPPSPQSEFRHSSDVSKPKEHSEKSNSLPIKTSSLFQTVHKPVREKKTMHVQPLQQVMMNSETDRSDSQQTSHSPVKQFDNSASLEKEITESVMETIDELDSVCEETPLCSLENTTQIENSSTNTVDTLVNEEKTELVPSDKPVIIDSLLNSFEEKPEHCSNISPFDISADKEVKNLHSDKNTNMLSDPCDSNTHAGSLPAILQTEENFAVSETDAEKSAQFLTPQKVASKSRTHFAPSGKKLKNGKLTKGKKGMKIMGKRICLSSLKQKANGTSSISGSRNFEVELKEDMDNDMSQSIGSELQSDKRVPNLGIHTVTETVNNRTDSSLKDSVTRSSEGLEAVYECCMKNIEIPSNRTYYNTKIFKKKYKDSQRQKRKVSNTSLCPDPTQPISSLMFHGTKLLCLKMTTDRFFIMRELLKCCFTSTKSLYNGVQKYKQIYLAKERDLNIPYVELPACQKDEVMQYLKKEGHLVSFSRATHVGIITVTDALRLYHFFKGVKLCGENCIEGENSSDHVITPSNCPDEPDVSDSANDISTDKPSSTASESGDDTSNSIEAYLGRIQQNKANSGPEDLSPISNDVVGSSICDRGVDTLSENEECHSDDSDATIPYINGIALKRRSLEDVRSVQNKRFKSASVYGGIAELYGNTFRFIALDGKKYVPFEDLCFYFDENDVQELVQQSCFEVHSCTNYEMNFLNKVDEVLPVLQENQSQLVETDVLHAIAGNAKSILQNFFKKNWQKDRVKMNKPCNAVEIVESSDSRDIGVTEKQTSETSNIEIVQCSDTDVGESLQKQTCNSEKTEEPMQIKENPIELEVSADETLHTLVDESQVNSEKEVVSNISVDTVSTANSVSDTLASPVESDVSQSKPLQSDIESSMSEASPEKPTTSESHLVDAPSIIVEMEEQWQISQKVMTKAFLALTRQNVILKDRITDLDREVKTMREQRQSMELLVKNYEEMLAVFREECG